MMDDLDIPQPSAAPVKASFAPIMKALDAARAHCPTSRTMDRDPPGYKISARRKTRSRDRGGRQAGTIPVQADALEQKFGVAVTAIDARSRSRWRPSTSSRSPSHAGRIDGLGARAIAGRR